MEFRVLGSLEIWDDDSQIEIPGAKRRAVLALLVLHANEVVGKDRLIDELWGEKAPRTAAASLHNHISRLRKVLGGEILATRAWGYVLRTDLEQIDLHQFERLVRDAEPLPARERSAKLAEALALWRGPALADLVFEPGLAKEVVRLEELRLAILEARIDGDLEMGRNAEIIGELEALIAEQPLRERLRGQLILALYRGGRQAEALEVYRETRRLLADELGLEPGRALRELERAILRQDPSLTPVAPSTARSEEIPTMRRRWLVYAALTGSALIAAGAIAAFAAFRHGESTPATQANSAKLPAFIAPEQRASHQARLATHQAPARRVEKRSAAAQPKSTATHRSRPIRTTVSGSASPARPQQKQKPTNTKKKRTNPTPKWTRIVDNFASDAVNPRLWDWGTLGTGVDIVQRNGRLEMTMPADTTPDPHWNAMDGYYQTSCTFTGDFDARIDYTLVDWPADNGTVVGLSVSFPGDNVHLVRKSLAPGEELYSFWSPSGEAREVRTTDMGGGFRMTRVGSLVTAYYRAGRRWSMFESAHRASAIRLQPTLWASGTDFAHKGVTVAFDNFSVETPYSACP
jgi:DNA-binding SARP family transcriptional activator